MNESDSEIEEDKEPYQIRAKVCMRLSREVYDVNIPDVNIVKVYTTDWMPPKYHGLNNCNQIIPKYYFGSNVLIYMDLDYLFMIKDSIRNFRKLNKYQLKYIRGLDHETKNELFGVFVDCMNCMIDTIENN